tara:strand:- start:1386 stop:2120 length:735 start_codon:yes stop_codon:yes gene_type:complete
MVEKVRSLLQLQSLDDELRLLDEEQQRSPAELSGMEQQLAALTERLSGVELVCAAEEARSKGFEEQLDAVEARFSRAQGRLAELVSAEQVRATERELESLGEQKGQLEEQALVAMERAESLTGDRQRLELQIEEQRADCEEQRLSWEQRRPGLLLRVEELDGFRTQILGGLSDDERRKYKVALSRGTYGASPPAGVTRVDGFICCTCHKRLPPMWVNESKAWTRLHCCDGCKRVLVFDPDDEQS